MPLPEEHDLAQGGGEGAERVPRQRRGGCHGRALAVMFVEMSRPGDDDAADGVEVELAVHPAVQGRQPSKVNDFFSLRIPGNPASILCPSSLISGSLPALGEGSERQGRWPRCLRSQLGAGDLASKSMAALPRTAGHTELPWRPPRAGR